MAFSMKSVAGGVGGTIVVSMTQAPLDGGVARGVFSNEADVLVLDNNSKELLQIIL